MGPLTKRPSTRADLWYARLLAVAGLVFAVYIPLGWGPPTTQELVPAEGALLSYSYYRFPKRYGNGDLVALMKLAGHPGRFWNDAVKNGSLSRLTGVEGRTIRVLYAPHGNARPVAGDAYKSYGLWIDGVEVESPEAALNVDRLLCYGFFPLFGIGIAVFGCLRARYISRTFGTGT